MTPDEIIEQAQQPRSATVDGVSVQHRSIDELVAAAEYLAKKRAAARVGGGIRLSKLIPGATVSHR